MNQEEKIIELLAEIKALKAENAKYKEEKKYGLVWDNERNKEEIVDDCKTKLPILERVKDKEIITDKTQPMNLMIEGDNYHALTCLNYTHQGKIDVIYIDPPYNTGAKDWKYNNDYVDSEDTFRHSKWINMMYNRLSITKKLLSESGIICITIDNNEYASLFLILTKIFSENNYLGTICIRNNPSGRTGIKKVSLQHEYAIFFAKNITKACMSKIYVNPKDKTHNYKKDKKGYFEKRNLRRGRLEREKPNRFFPIYIDTSNNSISLKKTKIFSEELLPCNEKNDRLTWDRSKKDIMQLYSEGEIWVEKQKGKYKAFFKFRPSLDGELPKSLWVDAKYSAREYGTNILKDILGDLKKFDYPKSIHAVKDTVSAMSSCKSSIILDFFAGSGTTGHAVLELNKKDGGNRKFILCTNNENNNGNGYGGIAEAVCYPRIQKVIEGYKKNGDGEWVAGLGGNLHYFKADENSFISVETLKKIDDKKRLELTLKAGELIAIRENIFDEKEHSKYYQIFEDNHKQVAIYFTEELIKLNELMEKLDSKKEKIVYLFGWGKTLFTGDDLGYPDINVKDIPEPIIRIYQEINR